MIQAVTKDGKNIGLLQFCTWEWSWIEVLLLPEYLRNPMSEGLGERLELLVVGSNDHLNSVKDSARIIAYLINWIDGHTLQEVASQLGGEEMCRAMRVATRHCGVLHTERWSAPARKEYLALHWKDWKERMERKRRLKEEFLRSNEPQ